MRWAEHEHDNEQAAIRLGLRDRLSTNRRVNGLLVQAKERAGRTDGARGFDLSWSGE